MQARVLEVDSLSVAFDTEAGRVPVVDRVSFQLTAGETLGLVGESGCGKSVTALSVMGLLPKPAGHITGGRVLLDGENLVGASSEKLAGMRGRRLAMVFQEPMTALNPVHRIGRQLVEAFDLHEQNMTGAQKRRRAIELLDEVGIPAAEQRLRDYPHQLSGGMRQRVLIAIALACRPDVLIADEPTTALDVTIQAQILELIKRLQRERGMAVLFITHDLGVIAELCDEVVVMYAGRVAERSPVASMYAQPFHPYSQGLLASIPRLESVPKSALPTIPGMVPDLLELPSGCRFRNRCGHADERCASETPELQTSGAQRWVACHHWKRLS
jgi:peptide/nickel transport system ATP-binding protein